MAAAGANLPSYTSNRPHRPVAPASLLPPPSLLLLACVRMLTLMASHPFPSPGPGQGSSLAEADVDVCQAWVAGQQRH